MVVGQKITLKNGRKVEISKKISNNAFVVKFKWPEGEGLRVATLEELKTGNLEVLLIDADFQKSVMPTVLTGNKSHKKDR